VGCPLTAELVGEEGEPMQSRQVAEFRRDWTCGREKPEASNEIVVEEFDEPFPANIRKPCVQTPAWRTWNTSAATREKIVQTTDVAFCIGPKSSVFKVTYTPSLPTFFKKF